ncbi:uncharacterized protein BXZ73DRAFT_106281 [Epithele typhae]|uniref:uncharacterized protein n=1 Tax=Epithele typhae TaxID=378194 RepID=UPI0020082AEC|nr:uncharacterized protein BXZ73DRAFT_106281 [Epithele typhae]KAH9915145.1 hypothetical protein BXZ73DRAFT_106281 [Epithele typhae]
MNPFDDYSKDELEQTLTNAQSVDKREGPCLNARRSCGETSSRGDILVRPRLTSPATDTRIQKALCSDVRRAETTVLVVTHRLPTAKDCDVILFFHERKVRGSWSEP